MEPQFVIEQTVGYVRKKLEGEATGHDWWHIYRVWKTAILLAQQEQADSFVVQLAALLHDIADWKFHQGDDSLGPKLAREWLETLQIPENIVEHVCDIIQNISFKGADVKTEMKTREGMIVQDADRLDALGAIGIARAFAYGGYKGREIYNPMVKPEKHRTFEEYQKNQGTSINHFYEKLLLLKDRMNTQTAKVMAIERHEFMETFLRQFFKEWGNQC